MSARPPSPPTSGARPPQPGASDAWTPAPQAQLDLVRRWQRLLRADAADLRRATGSRRRFTRPGDEPDMH